jgi:hypothetical protein
MTANPDAAYRRGAVLMSQRLARLERENAQLRAAVRHMARLIPRRAVRGDPVHLPLA